MSQQPLKLFVNYRRADERIFVELLWTHFVNRYGLENVFMDFEGIPPFADFEMFIRQKIREVDVVAMMIGPQWTELRRAKAEAGETDYVLIELQEALENNKVIAPICIMNAPVPDWAVLPDALRGIGRLNIASITNGRNLRADVHYIMNGFEDALKRSGQTRRAANIAAETAMDGGQESTSKPGLSDMLRRFTEARNNADYPQALLWLSELRASGQAIPAHFALDQKEADLQQRLREQEDRRRRREVADFQFEFVRAMLEIGDPDDIIQKAVEDIWQVEDGYIPDDLQKPLKKLLPRSDNTPDWTQAFALLRQRLPSPFDMIIIPAGSVTLGADDNGAKGGYITAPTTFDLAEFAIAKYPVTNAQFKLFIDAGGYREQRWWTEAGWAQRNADKWTQPRFWTDKKWNGAEYPVVGVSWYEAAAFCAWLAETTGLPVRLPGDAEWQRAAQGDDGRAYPWGNDWDGARCNHSVGKDWQKNQTSPVTRYEGKGDSPFGVVDMSGNAWEWCLTAYETGSNALEGTDVRMLRGGSWDLEDPLDFRAAYRYWSEPRDRYDVRGFRFMFSSLSL